MKEKTIFFGTSAYVIPIIEVLKKNFNLCLVITTERSQTQPVPKYCVENKIPCFSVSSFLNSNLKSLISNHKSPIGVVADFGLIIPESILNLFPKGIINIHPSLLPKYRGPTPVQTAILDGKKVTGISIMRIDKEIDHGPILTQTKEPILETDTSDSLYERLFDKSAHLLSETLEKYIQGNIILYAQNHEKATFTKTLKREDGFIDISNPPSKSAITRMIRAYFPWPGVYTKLKMNQTAGSGEKSKIIKFLPKNKIQVEGKKPTSYKDFINGYPQLKQIHVLLGRL